jgi:hypothetical protein
MAACEPGKTGKKAGIEPIPIRAYGVPGFCQAFRISGPSVYELFASGELHSVVRCRRRLILKIEKLVEENANGYRTRAHRSAPGLLRQFE